MVVPLTGYPVLAGGVLHLAPSQELRGPWTLLDEDAEPSYKAELTERAHVPLGGDEAGK